jgi:hypothetical protein
MDIDQTQPDYTGAMREILPEELDRISGRGGDPRSHVKPIQPGIPENPGMML